MTRGLTVALKSCQSPKFMFISFFNSSMLHWDKTLPFTLAWKHKHITHVTVFGLSQLNFMSTRH